MMLRVDNSLIYGAVAFPDYINGITTVDDNECACIEFTASIARSDPAVDIVAFVCK